LLLTSLFGLLAIIGFFIEGLQGKSGDENAFVYDRILFYDRRDEDFRAYKKDELEHNLLEECCRLKYTADGGKKEE